MQRIITQDFDREVAQYVIELGSKCLADKGRLRLSLSGGSTPATLYRALRQAPWDWVRCWITLGDERYVPSDHDRSNYRMARETLLDAVPLPESQVARWETEFSAEEAASRYEATLRRWAPEDNFFVHDIVLLGMGEDGHTASLFPGTAALEEKERWAVAHEVPAQGETRLTLTFPVLSAAENAIFLVRGESKRVLVEAIARGESSWPAAEVVSRREAERRETVWLLG